MLSNNTMSDNLHSDIYNKALDIISRREHSVKEVLNKLTRKFDADDDEYVAEAKQRQINMGLRTLQSPEEFLQQLYFNRNLD